jgi:hypothetical protein
MYEQSLVALVRALGAQHPTVQLLGRKLNALLYHLDDRGKARSAVHAVAAQFGGQLRPATQKQEQNKNGAARVKHRRGDPSCACEFCCQVKSLMPPGGVAGAAADDWGAGEREEAGAGGVAAAAEGAGGAAAEEPAVEEEAAAEA